MVERIEMLRGLLRIRAVEEAIADRYAEQEMRCPVHLSIGQEAVAVGVCAALRPVDYVLSTHRGHAHYLAKGGSLRGMLAEMYGKAVGCAGGRGGSMHLVDLDVNMMGCTPIVGSSLPIAVGIAFATQQTSAPAVTVAFFGEGATEEGVFFESVNFAALRKLPVVFVCENNGFSVYSPMSVRQPADRSRLKMVQANGVATASGDGNDVEIVFDLTRQAVEEARRGQGPCYLEFETYRWREHCGPAYDNHLGYRSEDEATNWKARCPVDMQVDRLVREGLVNPSKVTEMREEIAAEVEDAFAFAKRAAFPDRRQLLKHVLASGEIR